MTNNICSACNKMADNLQLINGIFLCDNIKTCINTNELKTLSPWDSDNSRKDILGNRVVYVHHMCLPLHTDTYIGVISCDVFEKTDFYTEECAKEWCDIQAVNAGYILQN